MKSLSFIDPVVAERVVFKQEILYDLAERLPSERYSREYSSEIIAWYKSITNKVALTPDEASITYELLEAARCYKPSLLFDCTIYLLQ